MKKKIFVTSFKAIDPKDGAVKTWAGPNVKAGSLADAQKFCEIHYGYLTIDGELA